MRVVVSKIDGVRSVRVSLKDGVATIQFAPGNRVTVARIREAIRSNGFTAREAELRVEGTLVRRGDTLALIVPGTDELFVLQDAPGSSGRVAELRQRREGTRVAIAGQLSNPGTGRGRGPERLLVRSFAAG